MCLEHIFEKIKLLMCITEKETDLQKKRLIEGSSMLDAGSKHTNAIEENKNITNY